MFEDLQIELRESLLPEFQRPTLIGAIGVVEKDHGPV